CADPGRPSRPPPASRHPLLLLQQQQKQQHLLLLLFLLLLLLLHEERPSWASWPEPQRRIQTRSRPPQRAWRPADPFASETRPLRPAFGRIRWPAKRRQRQGTA